MERWQHRERKISSKDEDVNEGINNFYYCVEKEENVFVQKFEGSSYVLNHNVVVSSCLVDLTKMMPSLNDLHRADLKNFQIHRTTGVPAEDFLQVRTCTSKSAAAAAAGQSFHKDELD